MSAPEYQDSSSRLFSENVQEDWEYYNQYIQQGDQCQELGPGGDQVSGGVRSRDRRHNWRRHKFGSLDTKSWDQAKQTISKGKK